MTLSFRTAGGREVARVSRDGGGCGSVQMSVAGRRGRPLSRGYQVLDRLFAARAIPIVPPAA